MLAFSVETAVVIVISVHTINIIIILINHLHG